MIKKITIAIGIATALGTASVAHAGYDQTFGNFAGNFLINNFQDGDNRFNISLTNLDGTVGLNIPAPGTYGATVTAGSQVFVDYDGVAGWDFGLVAPAAIPVGSGTLTGINGLSGINSMNFNFNGTGTSSVLVNGANLVPAGALPVQNVTVSGSGATSFFALLFGIPGFLTGEVSGALGVGITFGHDQLDFLIDSSNLVGTNLEGILAGLDLQGNNDGKIDGSFLVDGSVHIPEPGSLALLGLGLAGLSAARRRAVKAA